MKTLYKSFVLTIVFTLSVMIGGTAGAQEPLTEVGIAPIQINTIEFIGQIDQALFSLTSYGYVTFLYGMPSELLFLPETPAMLRGETAARFTFQATGTANGRSNYENIFASTTSATFNIYYNEAASGLTFDDPASFASGTLVATFEGRLYSMLNVQEPNIGVLLVHADTVQTFAEPFTIDGQSFQIGHVDHVARFTLYGQGFRESTEPLSAYYHIAGEAVSMGTYPGE